MQRLHFYILVTVRMDQRDRMRIEIFTIVLFGAGDPRCGRVRKIQFVAMTALLIGMQSTRYVQRVPVLLPADMPVRVCAREPCGQ